MNRTILSPALAVILAGGFNLTAEANVLSFSGTINQIAGGTSYDAWKFNVQSAGSFTVDLAAYEATDHRSTTVNTPVDINGDGEFTWLDPDTHIYKDDGHLDAADAIVRCDDTDNNCAVYQNGLSEITSPVLVSSHLQTEESEDGSVHWRRDPWFDVTFAQPGDYLFLVADYRLTPEEAEGRYNGFGGSPDSFSAPSGYDNPILDHADYTVTLSSDTMNFTLDGNTITVTAVPVPAAVWLFGTALAGIGAIGRRKPSLTA
ncbi:VPLPA-CTERM sorting domain-containing protein [Methylomonas sp. MgM2]